MVSKKSYNNLYRVFKKTLSSNWFFAVILALFALQMMYIAFFAIYPMLFDEEYHLGIIDIYSRQISPFIAQQPAEAAFHGDITRYGSYLFHYIMSVPYSIITHFTHSLEATVVAMRLLCIAFVILGVWVFKKFLISAGVSRAIANVSIAIFSFIPLVPFAFAQINYDSLAFLLIATIFYLTIKVVNSKTNQPLLIMLFLATSSLACLVKFTVLPIAFAAAVFIAISLHKKYGKKTLNILTKQFKNTSKIKLVLASLFLLFSVGLFVERYGVNIVKYHAIEPKCDRLHSSEECIQYTVWRRDTTWKQNNDAINKKRNNPAVYTSTYWAPHIFNDFFVVAAFVYDQDQPLQIRYLPTTMQASAGNKALIYSGWAMFVATIIAIAATWRKLPHKNFRYLVLITVGLYAVSLWLRNYSDYLSIGTGTAAQGRYFLPFLIPIFALGGLAWQRILTKSYLKIVFLCICVVLLSQGGGAANYMLYSNARWYWPEQKKTLNDINLQLRKVLRVYIPL